MVSTRHLRVLPHKARPGARSVQRPTAIRENISVNLPRLSSYQLVRSQRDRTLSACVSGSLQTGWRISRFRRLHRLQRTKAVCKKRKATRSCFRDWANVMEKRAQRITAAFSAYCFPLLFVLHNLRNLRIRLERRKPSQTCAAGWFSRNPSGYDQPCDPL